MRSISTAVLLASLLAGCAKHGFTLDGSGDLPSSAPDVKRWHSAVLWGIIELDTTDAKKACGDKQVVAVADVSNVWNTLVTAIAFNGIYKASTVKVWCGGGGAASVELPDDGAASTDVAAALVLDQQDQQSAFLSK